MTEGVELEVADAAKEQGSGEDVGGEAGVGRPGADAEARALGEEVVPGAGHLADADQGVSDAALVDREPSGRPDDLAEEQPIRIYTAPWHLSIRTLDLIASDRRPALRAGAVRGSVTGTVSEAARRGALSVAGCAARLVR